jgi:lymphocyte antigen 75
MPIITYNGAKPNKENTFLLDVKKEIWTGLKNTNSPALFQWSDGTEVTLTYWNENEPSVPFNKTPNCVSYLGKVGHLL